MSRSIRNPLRAAFLIDAHLLDTLIGAVALGVEEAALIHCPEQASATDLAECVLEKRGIRVHRVAVGARPQPGDAWSVFEALDRIGPGWHLHHTGGPDGLAELLIREAATRGFTPERCSMFDEERRTLRFDDGLQLGIVSLVARMPIRLDEALTLAQITRAECSRVNPGKDFVRLIAATELGDEPFGPRLRRHVGDRRAPAANRKLTDAWLRENVPSVIAERVIRDGPGRRGQWTQYLIGGWLEDFVAQVVRQAAKNLHTHCEMEVGVKFYRGATALELDVVALIGHRPHLISCTTMRAGEASRGKAYEAERRAWQLGGPVARPAVASGLSPAARPGEASIEAIFEEPLELFRASELEVFGWTTWRKSLRGLRRRKPLTELEDWIAAGLALTTGDRREHQEQRSGRPSRRGSRARPRPAQREHGRRSSGWDGSGAH